MPSPRLCALIAMLLTIASEASADPLEIEADPDPLVYNVELMDELLRRSTVEMLRGQKIAAITGVTIGTALIGLATWRLVEQNPDNAYSRGIGVGFMVAGAANLTAGVFAATRVVHETRRLRRWDDAIEIGVDADELARFEGELRASSEVRQGERLLLRWTSLTNALAGAVVLALAAVPDGSSNEDRRAGFIAGGIFMGVGLSLFATTFRPLPSENAWSEYGRRRLPSGRGGVRVGVAPSVMRRGGSLSLAGRF
ncbi:MAG: hypothetical protein AAGF92_07320 [Myxococcota bacterium]